MAGRRQKGRKRDYGKNISGGSLNEAAALGFILIILGMVCLFVINRFAGSKMDRVFG
jgi:ABC-type Fe3+ transport system permease subunit